MNAKKRFRAYITDKVSLRSSEWERIASALDCQSVKANNLVLSEGAVCRHLYFLDRGLLRFFQWIDGEDKTKFFTFEEQLFTAQQSYHTQQPAQETIQALEDSTLLLIHREQAQKLYQEVATWPAFIQQVRLQVSGWTEELLMESLNETAEQRYRRMLDEYPQRTQRIPLKHLASYLGIAPESLSRIRKKIVDTDRT